MFLSDDTTGFHVGPISKTPVTLNIFDFQAWSNNPLLLSIKFIVTAGENKLNTHHNLPVLYALLMMSTRTNRTHHGRCIVAALLSPGIFTESNTSDYLFPLHQKCQRSRTR